MILILFGNLLPVIWYPGAKDLNKHLICNWFQVKNISKGGRTVVEACEYFEVCKSLWEKGAVIHSYKLWRPFVKTATHNWRKFNNCFTVNGIFSKEQVAGMYLNLHWLQMRTSHLISALCLWKHCLHTSQWKIKLLWGPSCQISAIIPNADLWN